MRLTFQSQAPSGIDDEEECIVCCDNFPNAVQSPCGHGGLCKACGLEYLKNESKCMVCRKKIETLLIIEKDPETQCYFAIGEIKLQG